MPPPPVELDGIGGMLDVWIGTDYRQERGCDYTSKNWQVLTFEYSVQVLQARTTLKTIPALDHVRL